MARSKRQELIRKLLHNADEKFNDEELIHLLMEQNVSTNLNEQAASRTLGQRAADSVAKFAGSWAFIFCFLGTMAIWMVVNILMTSKAFDAYPFILLNLLLSCIAAVQAPLIMMSQNRQESKDRTRAESDYKVNLKNELMIDDLHGKLDQILENQKKLAARLDALEKDRAPHPKAAHFDAHER